MRLQVTALRKKILPGPCLRPAYLRIMPLEQAAVALLFNSGGTFYASSSGQSVRSGRYAGRHRHPDAAPKQCYAGSAGSSACGSAATANAGDGRDEAEEDLAVPGSG